MVATSVAKLDCVLVGDGPLLVQCGSLLIDRGHRISIVVTASDNVGTWAAGLGAEVLKPGPASTTHLSAHRFDWLFSIANLSLIPAAAWQVAKGGAANFHDGPLPRHAGLNAPAWALLAGERQYGVTWHAITDGVDEGDVYVQSVFDIDEHETALSLNTSCFEAGIATFAELVELIETGRLSGRPQDFAERTYHGRHDRPAAAAMLDFSRTSAEVARVVRSLSFGSGYVNPLGVPKLRTESATYLVLDLETVEESPPYPAGTIIASDQGGVVIATADGAVRIRTMTDTSGRPVDPPAALPGGQSIVPLTQEELGALSDFTAATAKHEAWFVKRLSKGQAPEISGAGAPSKSGNIRSYPLPALTRWPEDRAVAAIAGYFMRAGANAPVRLAYVNGASANDAAALPGFVAPALPLVLDVANDTTVDALVEAARVEIAALAQRRGHPADLAFRYPSTPTEPYTVAIRSPGAGQHPPMPVGAAITFVLSRCGSEASLEVDTARLPVEACAAMLGRLEAYFGDFALDGTRRAADLRIMSEAEELATIHHCNETTVPFDRSALIHRLIADQVARTPDAVALVCEDRSLTYRELDRQANRVAHVLLGRGAGPDRLIGLHVSRSCELVIGALAILKAGSAYVPLDPTYPADRIAYMIEDSGLELILGSRGLTAPMKGSNASVVLVEDALATADDSAPESGVAAHNLAYVIYTSGSTGRSKGVLVEHRNAINFFTGMDARVPRSDRGDNVWLAVTSLSFDISVLELFWTLSHGFKVVIHTDRRHATPAAMRRGRLPGETDFSLFFWGNDDGAGPRKYELLLESARYADERGFRAVWTPERHFHAFGGPYPNPAVTGAAVAAVTKNLDIRAGSCVLPLHHPARVAEEWAVIDNISNGRAGLAFASGWMPEDFLLRPENAPPQNGASMYRDIEIVRRLWRGEAVTFPGTGGAQVSVVTQPRPVSPELPIWVTTAGNPETYRKAARQGANVLTHLLGQSISELGEKIAVYRQALVETGRNPADYTVTLMLHTLLGEDKEHVRELARGPMTAYLRSAVGLIKQYAWAFPAFKKPVGVSSANEVDLQSLEPDDLDAIIEFAFLRYFDDSGLFGTVEDALARVEQVKAIGVDEIACLIDFGVPTRTAMAALQPLAEVVARTKPTATAPTPGSDFTIGNLIRANGATHLQMTPSMVAMLLMDDEARQALAGVRHLFIGGEALQGALVRELRSVTNATIENMYGPTETTVWSSTHSVEGSSDSAVPLGTPIANTQLYVLDSAFRPVPIGQAGELYIGGDGVTRGYLNRPELTAERFLPNPFTGIGRMYRTGDLVRRDEQGAIQFIGRLDHQVKVRGYRIELGEIEAHLGTHPSVAEAVAVVRQDEPNDVRIVAYIRTRDQTVSEEALRAHLREKLPDYMIPSNFVQLEKFPLTPNAKVDRSQLPRPGSARATKPIAKPVDEATHVAQTGDTGLHIAEAFKRILGLEAVAMSDNFFNLGGHSLLAVQLHRELKASLAPDLTIADIYRFPTVAGLAATVANRGAAKTELGQVAHRAASRRQALAARIGRRAS